ncbi:MAG: hypothetical protein LBQ66_05955 [Planctomycetaceae bacterium]|nr:hypothetical protein [Planctomycetaceae bacterium]
MSFRLRVVLLWVVLWVEMLLVRFLWVGCGLADARLPVAAAMYNAAAMVDWTAN